MLLGWGMGKQLLLLLWEGSRDDCSQVRSSEMTRLCYEMRQSKMCGLPFVTIPKAMHHNPGPTKEELMSLCTALRFN